jgi:uncharacterized protein YuzE
MRYDREDDVLMIWFAEGLSVDHAEQIGDSILHVSENGTPILLEVLNAQDFVLDLIRTTMATTAAAAG